MPAHHDSSAAPRADLWEKVDRAVMAFEQAWRSGLRPAIVDYLPPADSVRLAILVELIHVELERCLKRGEPKKVEDYLQHFHEIGDHPTLAVDLIVAEFQIRQQREPMCDPADYLQRFPAYRTELLARLPFPSGFSLASGAEPTGDEKAIPSRAGQDSFWTARTRTMSSGVLSAPTHLADLSQTQPVPLRDTIPGYELLEELGRGGMGVVYKARQVKLNRLVALKMILAGSHGSEIGLARFQAEAEAIARLRHPNIIQVYEIGIHDNKPYFSLEFCSEGSLEERLRKTSLLPTQAARLVEIVARAIHAAHQQNIIHRDLKPANVLLGHDGEPKITDFGLAKKLDETSRTQSGDVMGTPSYMAPEQARGLSREVGPAADLYALGSILYECLTGRPPFKAATIADTLLQVIHDEPVPVRPLQPKCPRALETICLKCLQKRPTDRYASGQELADDLARFLNGEPIQAQPPSALQRAVHGVRRRPVTAFLLLSAALLTGAVTAGLLWHTAQMGQALENAQQERTHAQESEGMVRYAAYASDLRLAQQLFKLGEVYTLPELLDRHLPLDASEDRRGFEWWYLAAQRPPALQAWHSHDEAIFVLTASPDGKLLAAGSTTRVKVWEVSSRQLRCTIPHQGVACDFVGPYVAFSPDSTWLAVADGSTVSRWNARTGQMLGKPLKNACDPTALAIFPDGRHLIAGGGGPTTIWNLEDGTARLPFNNPSAEIFRLALAPDGQHMVTTHHHDKIRFWDLTGKQPRLEQEVSEGTMQLAFGPHSALLVRIRGQELITQDAMWPTHVHRRQLQNGLVSLGVSSDGSLVAGGRTDGSVEVWAFPALIQQSRLRWQSSPVHCLTFLPGRKALAVGTISGMIYLLDIPPHRGPETLQVAFDASHWMAVSPDGKILATAEPDNKIKLIEVSSGRVRMVLTGHITTPHTLTFSHDGRQLASLTATQDLIIWDSQTGKKLSRLPYLSIAAMAFSPIEPVLALASHGKVLLWDSRGQKEKSWLESANPELSGLAFSPDGKQLAVVGTGPHLEVHDLTAQPSVPPLRRRGERDFRQVAFLPGGKGLLTWENQGKIRFWKIMGKEIVPAGPDLVLPQDVTHIQVSRDGQTLLTQGGSQGCTLWNLQRRAIQHRLHLPLNQMRYDSSALLMPTGQLAVQTEDQILQLINPENWQAHCLPGQRVRLVRSLAFSDDGRTLITGSAPDDRPIRYYAPFLFKQISMDSNLLQEPATTLRFWDVASRTEQQRIDGPSSMRPPHLVVQSPDGRTLAVGGMDGRVSLWDRPTRMWRKRLFIGSSKNPVMRAEMARKLALAKADYDEAVDSMAFSPNTRILAAMSSQHLLQSWNADSGEELFRLPGSATRANWVVFTPDGQLLTGEGGEIQFRDAQTGTLQSRLGRPEMPAVRCVAINPTGTILAAACADRHIRLWDLASGKVRAELIGHLDQIHALTFTPDGKTLASAGSDKVVRLWSVVAAAEVATLEAHHAPVYCLAFNRDGTVLASGGGDSASGRGEVFLWRAPRP